MFQRQRLVQEGPHSPRQVKTEQDHTLRSTAQLVQCPTATEHGTPLELDMATASPPMVNVDRLTMTKGPTRIPNS